QRTSWGPMQVMGAVARERGFRGPFEQLNGVWGLYCGCLLLERLRERFLSGFGWQGVAAAYNAGTPRRTGNGRWENQQYIDKLRRNGARFEEYDR
ncbi:lytic transglycosylase domain-containing protein, partial [Methylogaea oryzae]